MKRKKRDHKIEFVCLEYEYAQFRRAADARGMTLSAWIRDTLRIQDIRDRAISISATNSKREAEEAGKAALEDATAQTKK